MTTGNSSSTTAKEISLQKEATEEITFQKAWRQHFLKRKEDSISYTNQQEKSQSVSIRITNFIKEKFKEIDPDLK